MASSQKDIPAFIYHGNYGELTVKMAEDGHVQWIDDYYGFLIPIEKMQAILEYATLYIEQIKTNEEVERRNREYFNALEEQNRAWREETEARKSVEVKQPRPTFIYLIFDTKWEHYKIGKANNVSERFKQLKTANPLIELVCSYPGIYADEKALHEKFSSLRLTGEWFTLSEPNIVEFHEYFQSRGLTPTFYK